MNCGVLFAAVLTAVSVGYLLGRWDKGCDEKQRIDIVAGVLYSIMRQGDERRKAGQQPERSEEWCAGATWVIARWAEGV